MKKEVRGEKRTGHLPIGPFSGNIPIEQLLVRVILIVKPVRVTPDVNIAALGNGPEQG
jgi:hypothetical protein